MSRRTQKTTKYMFAVLAQLSENFIFIYLGLNLFTQDVQVFKPLFILVSAVSTQSFQCYGPPSVAVTRSGARSLTLRSRSWLHDTLLSFPFPNSSTGSTNTEVSDMKNYPIHTR